MLKSEERILMNRFGVPDLTVAYNALDIPETVREDPTPYNGLYGEVIREIETKIERGREHVITSTIRYIGGAAYEEITLDEDKVIEMLQKSVARKPIVITRGWNPIQQEAIDWRCPNCNSRFSTYHRNNYCSHCGQKLDWENWQEEMK